jgi:opacity protein-like surface antigen
MKKILFVIALLTVCMQLTLAQFEERTVEMSLTGAGGSYKISVTPGSGPGGSSVDFKYFGLDASIGYYLSKGLSIEPQLGVLFVEDDSPSESILLNLSYTRLLTNTSVALFARVGYGLSNGAAAGILNPLPLRVTKDWNVQIFNIGGGTKILVANNIALRIELNYRSNTYNEQDEMHSYYPAADVDYTLSNLSISFGFSVLL